MENHHLFWGDLHTHLEDIANGEAILRAARENIHFTAVLCYPFRWERKNGLRVESVRQRPEFLPRWDQIRELARAHHEPGRFVTFPGYEWHGNRTRYGDHNVIYFDDGDNPLDDAWTLEELYRNLRTRRALAIPHHTGYAPGQRSKDWSVFDGALSPVMEVFSGHGSSEGPDTPFPLIHNPSMGPRASGGTFQDALARGHRLGVIGSNDGPGLPGRWGLGRAGVWARACTREAIWEALQARRTYAVTGDRIELRFQIEDAPMGSVLRRRGDSVEADVRVVGSHAIDRIELLHNGVVVDARNHSGTWEPQARQAKRFKVRVEAGWGALSDDGFQPQPAHWSCRLEVADGSLAGVESCFSLLGQRIVSQSRTACAWEFTTAARLTFNPFGLKQGLIFEIEGGAYTRLRWQIEGAIFERRIGELIGRSELIPLLEESQRRVREKCGLSAGELENPDVLYHNARKILIHPATPEAGYRVAHRFPNLRFSETRNDFYVRVSQRNGQMAWSSPIWVERPSQ